MFNVTTSKFTRAWEVGTDEFTEAGGVVVSDGFGVTEGFQYGIGLNDLFLEGTDLLAAFRLLLFGRCLLGCTDDGKVWDNLLGVFGFTGSGFTGDKHGLIFTILNHVSVSFICDGEKMGWHFVTSFTHVTFDDGFSVDGESLVGVDDDTEETRISLK